MQTLHIFDEYPNNTHYYTDQDRHLKRQRVEPLIFDILKTKYGKILKDRFNLYNPPSKGSEKGSIVIVERRIHQNLEFLIHNAATAAPDWSIVVVCSDTNYDYCRLIGDNKITLIPFFTGVVSSKQGRDEYNHILQVAEFYQILPSENLLFMEVDSWAEN